MLAEAMVSKPISATDVNKDLPSSKEDAATTPTAADCATQLHEKHAVDDSTYGLAVDPSNCFEDARNTLKLFCHSLDSLEAIELPTDSDGAADPSVNEKLSSAFWDVQRHLLAMRRVHRAVGKALELGKASEASTRRIVDAEHAHLESRRYENSCLRAAAAYCRVFPMPALSAVRPFLREGLPHDFDLDAENSEEEVDAAQAIEEDPSNPRPTQLAKRLNVEFEERKRLAEEFDSLTKKKLADLRAFADVDRYNKDMFSKLRSAELALEPVCNLLELRPRPTSSTKTAPDLSSQFPDPLRLICSKFDVFSAFGDAGHVSVKTEPRTISGSADGEPAQKKAKLAAESSAAVRVTLTGAKTELCLVFACGPNSASGGAAAMVGVSCEGASGYTTLDNLWPDDDGRSGPLASAAAQANVPGRVYRWVQVLAGLRDQVAFFQINDNGIGAAKDCSEKVVASEVIGRIRKRLSNQTS